MRKNENVRTCAEVLKNMQSISCSFSNIRRLAVDLMQTSLNNRPYSKRINCEITKLKVDLEMAKIDYFLTVKDDTSA